MSKLFRKQANFTMLDNAVVDVLMRQLTGGSYKVLTVIIRKTVGWHKEQDRISISQLMEVTGMSNKGVIKATEKLVEKGIITKKQGDCRSSSLYLLNMDYALEDEGCEQSSQGGCEQSSHTKENLKIKEQSVVHENTETPPDSKDVGVYDTNFALSILRDAGWNIKNKKIRQVILLFIANTGIVPNPKDMGLWTAGAKSILEEFPNYNSLASLIHQAHTGKRNTKIIHPRALKTRMIAEFNLQKMKSRRQPSRRDTLLLMKRA